MGSLEHCLKTPNEFRSWLAEQAPEAKVGKASSSCECPIANFLKCKGFRAPYVWGDFDGIVSASDQELKTPGWAMRFIYHLDREERQSLVSASDAMMLLEELMRDRAGGEHD